MKNRAPDSTTIRSLASEVLKLTSAADRSALLSERCLRDDALRTAVEQFVLDIETETIAGHKDGESSGRSAPAAPIVSDQPLAETIGSVIGPFTLTRVLGEGGFGIVYEAKQQEPVRRSVALKIIKPGMDSAEVIARFRAERQALAQMDHPGIAKVFDAGATESGRPYFAMELVDGQPITEFCDRKNLNPRERLELLIPVAQAVQHAHQKAIIHRDLKPSNILVSEQDGSPAIKVIDFGIAKALSRELSERTFFTAQGMVVGTPEYMSPEQASANPDDIDTRSDIYSLGIVLYELLTGSTPLEAKSLRKEAYDQILKLIREAEPPLPSTRIRSLQESGEAKHTAAVRSSDTTHLAKTVRGELDWIAMKALEKDRERRYESISAFIDDLRRYLNNEALSASPPSAVYRFRKFVRRNRGPLSAAATVVIAMGIGTVVSINQTIRAEKARHQAEAVADFMVTAFRSPDPYRDGSTITIAEVLDRAANEVESGFSDDPETRGRLLNAIGRTYQGLGLDRQALRIHEAHLKIQQDLFGPNDPATLIAGHNVGNSLSSIGRHEEAVRILERTVAGRTATLGPDHLDTIGASIALGNALMFAGRHEEAIELHERNCEIQIEVAGLNDEKSLDALSSLGSAFYLAGDFERAAVQYERVLQLRKESFGPESPQIAESLTNLAAAWRQIGRSDEAIGLSREVLRISEKNFGPDHQRTLGDKAGLGLALSDLGEYDEALALLESAVEGLKAKLSSSHPQTLIAMRNLAIVYGNSGRATDAVEVQRAAADGMSELQGRSHPETLSSLNSLATALIGTGDFEEAEKIYLEIIDANREQFGEADSETLRYMFNLVALYFDHLDRKEDALKILGDSVEIRRRQFGADHADTLVAQSELARGYGVIGQYEKVIELLEPIFAKLALVNDPGHNEVPQAALSLAEAWRETDRFQEAETLLVDTLAQVDAMYTAHPKLKRPVTPDRVIANLIRLYKKSGNQEKDEHWRKIRRDRQQKAAASGGNP